MASLADCPNEEMPWWAMTVWYRCRICKTCFQFQEDLLKHKEKHLSPDLDSSIDSQIEPEPPISVSLSSDDSSALSMASPPPLDDDPVVVEATTPPHSPTPTIYLSSLESPEPENSHDTEDLPSAKDKELMIVDSIEEEEQVEESVLDRTGGDNIIHPDPNLPSVIMRCEKSQNSDEEVEIEDDSSPVRQVKNNDAQSQKSSSLISAGLKRHSNAVHRRTLFPCPFCRKKFSTQMLKEKHVDNCQRPYNYRRRNYTKRTSNEATSSEAGENKSVPKCKTTRINTGSKAPHRFRPSTTSVLRKQPKRTASSEQIRKSSILTNLTVKNSREVKGRPKRKLAHKCQICQKILPDQQSLQIHNKQHLNKDKPFLCNICNLRFVTKPGLTNHLITKHSKVRNHEL